MLKINPTILATIIEVQKLTKEYRQDGVITPILNGLSFTIAEGEWVAIMGPSGSGKSTLMHILGLLDRQSGGIYYFQNQDTQKLTDDELAHLRNHKIGFVFQSFNLLNRTTVLENVKLPLSYSQLSDHKAEDKRAREVIESVGLSHRLNNWPSQLSGGEQQRVAIARALINNPSVVFADEPTGNLDSKSGEQIMKILSELNSKGHTIVVVTHEIYIAKQAQRVIYLKDGLILKEDAFS